MTNDSNDWMNDLDHRRMAIMREMTEDDDEESCVAMITSIIRKHMDFDYYMVK